jgi:hypothetical protein
VDPSAAEGYCAVSPSSSSSFLQPLVLWAHPTSGDLRTCGGSADCTAAAMAREGYAQVGTGPLCYALPAGEPADLPCDTVLPSIARDDPAFWDQLCVDHQYSQGGWVGGWV